MGYPTYTNKEVQGTNVSLECPACYTKFSHSVNVTAGDPRNIVLIGHWDGWQPFSTSSKHSSGEVLPYCTSIIFGKHHQ